MSAHLTNEELTDNLLGVSSLTVNAHLMHCPTCTGELERMKRSISDFRGAAEAWSENHLQTANSLSVTHAAPKTSWGLGNSGFGNWMLVAVAMIVFAAGLTFYMHNHRNSDQAEAVRVATPVNTVETSQSQVDKGQMQKDQLEKDNELLSQVDSEIAEAVPAPMQPLRLMESNSATSSTGKK